MEKFFNYLYYAFIALLLVFGALLAASYIGIGGISVKIVQSGSMEPAIKTGSIVVVKPVSDYQVDDVITFVFSPTDQIPTTHRIVEERIVGGASRYITKGDANEDRDPREVLERNVDGKVLFSIPFLGYLLDFARQPLGFGLLVGIPAAYVVFEEATKIVSEVRRTRRKDEPEPSEKENENS